MTPSRSSRSSGRLALGHADGHGTEDGVPGDAYDGLNPGLRQVGLVVDALQGAVTVPLGGGVGEPTGDLSGQHRLYGSILLPAASMVSAGGDEYPNA
jgi:hypothetical protein